MISYKTLSQLVAPILQLLFVVGCVAGFIFQVVEFVQFYYEYSTTVEIKIEPVKEITFPTVAFCSNSRMNFSHWCVIRPNDCVTNLTSVRDVIKWNHYINSLTVAEMKEAGFQLDKSLVYCSVMGYYGCDPLYKSYTSVYGNCLTINNDWLPHAVIGNRYADESFIRMQFYLYVETNVTFPLNNGVVVAFSSPGSVPDIVNEVYSLEFGKMHVFSLSQSISHLLPPPYATNCTDYEKMGKASFRGGLLTKQTCFQECLANLTLKTCGCMYEDYPYLYEFPGPVRRCQQSREGGVCRTKPLKSETVDARHYCEGLCRIPCREYAVKVSLIIHNKEVTTYQHHPKYQDLELFSYIGGYLGIWLGISLANILDVIINLSVKVKNWFLYLKGLSSNTILPFQQAVVTTYVKEK
ncbi:bile acid-sensitive ion channel-like isoform X2 [Tachypleus tridentatus]|uniref:bile acid-sensitive ion channel-like isoform X2 n=1 Tax=Tachypleus tridentatus TaxID=6853 RepID=UPI003FD2B0F1